MRSAALRRAPRSMSRHARRSRTVVEPAASPASPSSSAASASSCGPPRTLTSAAARRARTACSGGSRVARTASRVSACRHRSRVPSATSSPAPAAVRNARSTAGSSCSVTAASRVQSGSVPRTAAACRTSRAGSSRLAIRRATSPANVGGTGTGDRARPGSSSPTSSSSTRNGNPSALSSRISRTSAGTGALPAHWAARTATAASSRRPNRSVATPSRPPRSSATATLCRGAV